VGWCTYLGDAKASPVPLAVKRNHEQPSKFHCFADLLHLRRFLDEGVADILLYEAGIGERTVVPDTSWVAGDEDFQKA